ncbi:hypothetical protein M2459_000981 [Parabacteroides sp. PF5-5]|uniref:MutS-related protein n=1 Tax=unclassified Parabacteroides TaxID=2649774 RepID=UPI00247587B6|nr:MULTISPECIES: MutS family DNA mismatch repair protein [unclassified Parabacteroides]MDH6304253.1 membrane protein implicated in regulation of membrane protease activity [Parabacteroides sp. PH5-39]MDH6315032.1 membrane protein implicated in regulation of membrane protease activity [Parabacteroides sp. PF5-13]MDH6318692.1 membrane protein implicated in regulation of membrane protease activity [Parabacteroides sp. PH5-13]MDH6322422.1 membrane protein implicated in regulation of membrane protea
MEKVHNYYQNTIEAYTRRVDNLQKKIHLFGTIRLLIVIVAIINIWVLKDMDWKILAGIFLLYAIPFAVLMFYHSLLSNRKTYAEALIRLCSDELKGLNYDFSAFDGAPEKIDGEHSFSLDLDIFGNRSFFQSINRTVTHIGKELLINWLSNPLTNKADILKRQEAVKELSTLSHLRQHFYVTGTLQPGKKNDSRLLSDLSKLPAYFSKNLFWKTSVWLIPCFWLLAIIALGFNLIHPTVFSILFVLSFLIAYSKLKKINEIHNTVNKMEKIFATYARLMKSIEGDSYKSELLSDLSNKLICDNIAASQAVKKLSSHIGTMDQRGTLTAVLLNIFTFRDIRAAIAIEKWNQTYGKHIDQWFDALANFDALCSLSGFYFNHPDYMFPEIADSYFEMSGKALGHPLIPRNACVKNDISIEKNPWFLIITGANMAGKSTYLRTIGINFLLACIGAPVCAEKLSVYPAQLVTSLRTSDSLVSNESYFFAELKRLKMIIDRLKEGEELFIILDEILKGTNSVDKQKGSFALMKQLITYNTCGIIATHDLALGTLEEEFPNQIKNYRFEADITNNELTFSYLLREGVAQNMNASFLMKKMGITI